MLGLTELLEGNAMKTLFRRFGSLFENMKSTEKDATSTSDWVSCDIPDAGVVPPSIMWNEGNVEWSRRASDDELVTEICGESGEITEARLMELIVANGAFSRAPHAWRALCWRHGEALARRLVFEKPLRDCTRWEVKVPENRPCAIVGVHTGKVICMHTWFARFYTVPAWIAKHWQKNISAQQARIDNIIREAYSMQNMPMPRFGMKDRLSFIGNKIVRWLIKVPQRILNWPNKLRKKLSKN